MFLVPRRMEISLNGYEWLLRGVVELLDLFPPGRLDKEEVYLRKGGYDPMTEVDTGTVWVHGASLGEVITLRPFLSQLAGVIGKERLVASATTMDGYRRLVSDGLCGHATLLPIELPEYLGPFLTRMKPRLLLISETEIWPLLLTTLHRRGIPYGIINGRVNERTVRFLRLLRPLFAEALDGMAFVYPQDDTYARRFRRLGISSSRISPLGCFKYDIDSGGTDPTALRVKFGIPPGRLVWCFGSTHAGEEQIILDALDPLWKSLNVTVVIAPRKMDRLPEIERLLQRRHLDYSRLSDHRRPASHILLVDGLGVLRDLYRLSSLAFVGGSLVEHGGHNLMEPAACGVPVLSGPHTWNFPSETEALRQARALTEVRDPETLRGALTEALANPGHLAETGRQARAVLDRMAGASRRTVEALTTAGYLSHGG